MKLGWQDDIKTELQKLTACTVDLWGSE